VSAVQTDAGIQGLTVIEEKFDFEDLFCGGGGSITGMIEAGGRLVAAANHFDKAIETVERNHGHTGAKLLCVDINNYNMHCLPKAQVLWASVICTEVSPAGGNRKLRGQMAMELEEFGHVPNEAFERTRACAWDVIRATETHRYDIVVVENVVEFARDWELFDAWTNVMCNIRPGYEMQIVSLDSAHIAGPGNAPAPQWRGRIYVVFNRKGVRKPNLELRPTSYCPRCDGLVEGVQWWKRADRRQIGVYGDRGQYRYRCSQPGCNTIVEPLVRPAIDVIDLTDIGMRIRDRKKPLAANTMARIQWGADNLVAPLIATVAGNTHERGSKRVWPAQASPLMARTTTSEDAVVVPPFTVKNNGNLSEAKYRALPTDTNPLGSVTTSPTQGLVTPMVVPNRMNNRARLSGDDALSTVTTAPGGGHLIVNTNHDDSRVGFADDGPFPARTKRIGDMIIQPLVSAQRANSRPAFADESPVATVAAGGNHLDVAFPEGAMLLKQYGGNARDEHMVKHAAGEPFGAVTTKDHHHLVIPYRRGKPKPIDEPMHTLGTRESLGLTSGVSLDILDWYYRMLKPREHALAQRFPDWYEMVGNLGEQTMLAGNAVSVNAPHFIGAAIAEALA
jgi:DNA (cytosine-5)-methyltransferase 1